MVPEQNNWRFGSSPAVTTVFGTVFLLVSFSAVLLILAKGGTTEEKVFFGICAGLYFPLGIWFLCEVLRYRLQHRNPAEGSAARPASKKGEA